MAERTVTVRLTAEVSRYKAAMQDAANTAKTSAAQASKSWGDSLDKNAASWDTVGNAATIGGAAVVAGIGAAVKKYADFDSAMSNVKAATHASSGEMEQLRAAAIKAGADTAYSGQEAAQGIEELAKAGISTKDILNGGLNGALSLAAAGQLEVGDAAEIAATAMTQFGLSGDQVGHVADLLAAGAGKAQGSVGDLGMALNQSGLVASQAGLSIEETTGTLAAFASAGLVGSDAGTSFKTMLQRLQNPSKEAQRTMDELGISMYDSQGNFVGMANLAEQLKTSMEGLTPAQRDAAMATIFGSDAVRAASVLYQQGASGINDWINKVNDSGYAAETAAAKQDNLAGDLEKLGGAIDTVVLQSGSGLNDFLRSVVQFAESAVDAFGQIPGPVLEAGAAIAGIGGAALLMSGGIIKAVGFARDLKGALSTLGFDLDGLKGRFSKTGADIDLMNNSLEKGTMHGRNYAGMARNLAATIAGLAIAFNGSLHEDVEGVFKDGADAAGQFGDNASDAVNKVSASFASAEWANGNAGTWSKLWDGTASGINNVGDAVTYLNQTGGMRDFTESVNDMLGNSTALDQAKADIESLDAGMAQLANGGNMEQAQSMFQQFAEQAKASGGSVEDMTSSFPQLIGAVQQYGESLGVSLSAQEATDYLMGQMPPKLEEAAAASENMAGSMGELGAQAEETQASLDDVYKALTNLGMAYMSQEQAMGTYYENLAGLGEAVQQVVDSQGQMGEIFDFTTGKFNQQTEAGRLVSDAFYGIASSGFEMVEAMANNGAAQGELQGALQQTYNDLINAAGQFGVTGDQADDLARAVLGIPPEADIETWMSDSAKNMAEATDKAVNNIPDEHHTETSISPMAERGAVAAAGAIGRIQDSHHTETSMSDTARREAVATEDAVRKVPTSWSSVLTASEDAYNTANRTKNEINSIQSRRVSITVDRITNIVENWIGGKKGKATGGLAGEPGPAAIRGFARGGGLIPGVPPTNRLADNLPAVIQETREPIMVRSREFIVNEPSTWRGENLSWLRWMNAGGTMPTPAPRGFAVGGSPAALPAPAGTGGAVEAAPIHAAIESGVDSALSRWQVRVEENDRGFAARMKRVQKMR